MTRYRIVQVDKHKFTWYEVERQGWFGWSTVRTYVDVGIACDKTFKTKEEALEFIEYQRYPIRTVIGIKEIEEGA